MWTSGPNGAIEALQVSAAASKYMPMRCAAAPAGTNANAAANASGNPPFRPRCTLASDPLDRPNRNGRGCGCGSQGTSAGDAQILVDSTRDLLGVAAAHRRIREQLRILAVGHEPEFDQDRRARDRFED